MQANHWSRVLPRAVVDDCDRMVNVRKGMHSSREVTGRESVAKGGSGPSWPGRSRGARRKNEQARGRRRNSRREIGSLSKLQEGSDTPASERWPHEDHSPTVSDVLTMLDRLGASLSARERKKRATAFAQARAYIPQLAASGCIAPPPIQASFPKPPLKGGVRVDVNVFEGRIVPDP